MPVAAVVSFSSLRILLLFLIFNIIIFAEMVGDTQTVTGYLERAQVAKTMAEDGRWAEAANVLKQLMADVKTCKIAASNREDTESRTVSKVI